MNTMTEKKEKGHNYRGKTVKNRNQQTTAVGESREIKKNII